MTTHILLFKVTLIAYFTATVLYLVNVVIKHDKSGRFARWVLFGGIIVHFFNMALRYYEVRYTPVADLHGSLSFFALCLIVLFLLFDMRYRLPVMGAFISPLAMILMIFAGISHKPLLELNPVLDSWWFPIHITFAFLGNAAFSLAFAAGVMYLLQNRMLKSKRFSALYYRLPSLDTLDRINYSSLTIGFPLMTMGIISGAIWAESVWGTYWSWDPKETWALITWFLYAALLHGRLSIGWRGKRAAIFAIIGFCCLLFTFLGVNLLLSGQHTFEALRG